MNHKEQEPEMQNVSPQVIAIAGLAAEYCLAVDNSQTAEPSDFCAQMLRYLPRIYVAIDGLRPYGSEDGDDTGMIFHSLDEDAYTDARISMERLFGEHDMYLDAPQEEMRFSDTPVAVSLSEKLADIYQNLYDVAYTIREADSNIYTDVMSELKWRFDEYLSMDICDALRAANIIYRNRVLNDEQ